MISYRRFRNPDPPALVAIWNEAFTGRGSYQLRNATLLEHCVFSKPYFDPAGLILAEDDGKPIGFIHAGFGPTAAETDLDLETGVICVLAVRPSDRRRNVASGLLAQAEEYLRGLGAKQFIAGAQRPLNPFYFGLYGGADSPGFLASDTAADPFFERHGYAADATTLVFERSLTGYQPAVDPRFVALRRRYDVQLVPQPEIASWWQECVLGCFEPAEFRLTDKLSGIPAARCIVWDMSAGRNPGQSAAGLLDVQVRADVRRQGLARFLTNQLLRYVQEQYFKTAEVHVPEANESTLALYRGLGFVQVDVGRSYKKAIEPLAV